MTNIGEDNEIDFTAAAKMALQLISGDRNERRGDPMVTYTHQAVLMTLCHKRRYSVCEMINAYIFGKQARESYSHDPDNPVDIIGYTSIYAAAVEHDKRYPKFSDQVNFLALHYGIE